MRLGYNIWNDDQTDHVDDLLVSLKDLGIKLIMFSACGTMLKVRTYG